VIPSLLLLSCFSYEAFSYKKAFFLVFPINFQLFIAFLHIHLNTSNLSDYIMDNISLTYNLFKISVKENFFLSTYSSSSGIDLFLNIDIKTIQGLNSLNTNI